MDALRQDATQDEVAPATREVLHDLTTERGLVDWRLLRLSGRDVIVGSAVSERLQDNRLQRKRKHRGGAGATATATVAAEGGDAETAPSTPRSLCSFVVVSTAQEPTLTMESLLDLHTTARHGSPDEPVVERVYLCLTDAGNISYYQLADGFAPFSPADSVT